MIGRIFIWLVDSDDGRGDDTIKKGSEWEDYEKWKIEVLHLLESEMDMTLHKSGPLYAQD